MQMIQLLDIQDTAAYVMDVTCRKMTAELGRLRVDESNGKVYMSQGYSALCPIE